MEMIINSIPPLVAKRPGRLLSIGSIRSGLSPDAENANCSVTMDNGDGHFSRLFALAPLGTAAVVRDGSTTVFTGVITAVVLTSTCQLTLEA